MRDNSRDNASARLARYQRDLADAVLGAIVLAMEVCALLMLSTATVFWMVTDEFPVWSLIPVAGLIGAIPALDRRRDHLPRLAEEARSSDTPQGAARP